MFYLFRSFTRFVGCSWSSDVRLVNVVIHIIGSSSDLQLASRSFVKVLFVKPETPSRDGQSSHHLLQTTSFWHDFYSNTGVSLISIGNRWLSSKGNLVLGFHTHR